MTTSEYLLDNRAAAAERRFGALSALFDDGTFRHIQTLGIRRSWRCWEVRAVGAELAGWPAGSDRTATFSRSAPPPAQRPGVNSPRDE